jgi:hypothetical protein
MGAQCRYPKSAKEPLFFPIHFDVPGHALRSTRLSRLPNTQPRLFALWVMNSDGALVFQVVVVPPAEGSFKTRLGVIVVAGAVALWGFVESDIGKDFVRGITTKDPTDWYEQLGQTIRTTAIDLLEEEVQGEDEELCTASAEMLVEPAANFFQADTNSLQPNGITVERYRNAYYARNKFYRACESTVGLQGVGFSEAPTFPVRQNDFARLQVPIQPREDEPEPWIAGVTTLKVTFPNWNRDDRARQWKARDPKGRNRFFRVDDENFWLLVRQEKLNHHIVETMRVQWAFQGTHNNTRNAKVFRVLTYNDKTLAEPLDDRALDATLGTFITQVDEQGDFFELEARGRDGKGSV